MQNEKNVKANSKRTLMNPEGRKEDERSHRHISKWFVEAKNGHRIISHVYDICKNLKANYQRTLMNREGRKKDERSHRHISIHPNGFWRQKIVVE